MKALLIAMILPLPVLSQSVHGRWITVDDYSGEEKSVVELFERDGRTFGRIIKIFVKPGEDPDPVCDQCPDDDSRYGKKIIGMEIIRNLQRSGNTYSEGDILDPENGKTYRCKIWREGDELKVRGFWGPFFRTQTWKKAF